MDGPAQQQSGHLQVHLCGCSEWGRGEAQEACEEEEEGPTAQTHISGGASGAHKPQGEKPVAADYTHHYLVFNTFDVNFQTRLSNVNVN